MLKRKASLFTLLVLIFVLLASQIAFAGEVQKTDQYRHQFIYDLYPYYYDQWNQSWEGWENYSSSEYKVNYSQNSGTVYDGKKTFGPWTVDAGSSTLLKNMNGTLIKTITSWKRTDNDIGGKYNLPYGGYNESSVIMNKRNGAKAVVTYWMKCWDGHGQFYNKARTYDLRMWL
ncbi:MAG: hypothetical protein GX318_06995 [Clostridia bacterium]|nr:hypothetical protein [Clostridia bacterium]